MITTYSIPSVRIPLCVTEYIPCYQRQLQTARQGGLDILQLLWIIQQLWWHRNHSWQIHTQCLQVVVVFVAAPQWWLYCCWSLACVATKCHGGGAVLSCVLSRLYYSHATTASFRPRRGGDKNHKWIVIASNNPLQTLIRASRTRHITFDTMQLHWVHRRRRWFYRVILSNLRPLHQLLKVYLYCISWWLNKSRYYKHIQKYNQILSLYFPISFSPVFPLQHVIV